MFINDIYSKRQRKLRGEIPEVYRYDNLPRQLRVQIIHILRKSLGDLNQLTADHIYLMKSPYFEDVNECYVCISEKLCSEHGILNLPTLHSEKPNIMNDLFDLFLQEANVDKAIDFIELSFDTVDCRTRMQNYLGRTNAAEIADLAIKGLNERFKEHGAGYYFEKGQIFRIDSKFIHSEVVKPALRILNKKEYTGAQEEFLRAHEHYREGQAKEALNECLKSLESVLKSICDRRGWNYDSGATAKNLIDICFENEIIPRFWQQQFNALRSLLESGVPTARNKLAAHGQGNEPQPVPIHLVSFVLHMTAAAIVFLADADTNNAIA